MSKKSNVTQYDDIIIDIEDLDLDLIQPNHDTFKNPKQGGSKIVAIGKPGTGKSTIIASILHEKEAIFPVGMVMSGTEDTNGFYSNLFPSTFVFNNYDEKQIQNFIRRQKISRKYITDYPWAVMIIDDCTDDPSVFQRPTQLALYKNGRHWKMLYILSLQYAVDIRPAIRTAVDGVFILREPNTKIRKVIYENYCGNIIDPCEIVAQKNTNAKVYQIGKSIC